MTKSKTLVFEALDIQKQVIAFYDSILKVLNEVRAEFLALEIGPFNLPDVLRFTEQGAGFVVARYEEAFNKAMEKMPRIIYGALNELPKGRIARQFQPFFNRLAIQRDQFGMNESLINRHIISKCTNLKEFLSVSENGEVILSEKSQKAIIELTRYYAESPDEIKLFETGQKIQEMFNECMEVWKLYNADHRHIISLPGDKHIGLFDVNIDSRLTFNPFKISTLK